MRILLITQWFDPEPTLKGLVFAQELQQRGHEVEVVTGFPNYPNGKLYPGYKIKVYQYDTIENIPVLRVPLYPSHNNSSIQRILNYLSFGIAACIGVLFLKRPDIVYVYHPPPTSSLPALMLHFLKGVPFVYDIQDLWPDTLSSTNMIKNHFILKFINGMMQKIYSYSAHIVVLSNGFKERLVARGVPQHKITVVPNWAPEKKCKMDVSQYETSDVLMSNKFNVVFAGTMGKAQSLETILDSAYILKDIPEIHFTLIGGGVECDNLQLKVRTMGIKNVSFLPYQPFTQVHTILSNADALLVHLKDDPLFSITIPSKTQTYLMVGKPILMGVRGDAANIIESAEAGLVFEPQNPQDLANNIKRLVSFNSKQLMQMGGRGKNYYYNNLSMEKGVSKFIDIFERNKKWNG